MTPLPTIKEQELLLAVYVNGTMTVRDLQLQRLVGDPPSFSVGRLVERGFITCFGAEEVVRLTEMARELVKLCIRYGMMSTGGTKITPERPPPPLPAPPDAVPKAAPEPPVMTPPLADKPAAVVIPPPASNGKSNGHAAERPPSPPAPKPAPAKRPAFVLTPLMRQMAAKRRP